MNIVYTFIIREVSQNHSSLHIVTRVGDNNFQSKSPTANGLIIQLLTFS